jgi:dihydrofolate synthase/folylpolyglutamate synthase
MLQQQLEWMFALSRFGIKPGLGVMQQMMEVVGHPETAWPSVHIAGTNGKGSTAALVASALREAGYTVGLYTSPHLITFNERIQINGVEIRDEELGNLIVELRERFDKVGIEATFFEFTTALAFTILRDRALILQL